MARNRTDRELEARKKPPKRKDRVLMSVQFTAAQWRVVEELMHRLRDHNFSSVARKGLAHLSAAHDLPWPPDKDAQG
jgi:hypothetical protein